MVVRRQRRRVATAIALSLFASMLVSLALVVFLPTKNSCMDTCPSKKPRRSARKRPTDSSRSAGFGGALTICINSTQTLGRLNTSLKLTRDRVDGRISRTVNLPQCSIGIGRARVISPALTIFETLDKPARSTRMIGIKLAHPRRLLEFYAVPPQVDSSFEFRN